MHLEHTKEVIRIIKSEPLSVLIIFSLLILPVIFFEWAAFFPAQKKLWVVGVVIGIWCFALYRLWIELKMNRRKTILLNYLRKRTRASINHLSKEWAAKKEFTKKNIDKLLLKYPTVFRRVDMGKYGDGVGLVSKETDEELKALEKT